LDLAEAVPEVGDAPVEVDADGGRAVLAVLLQQDLHEAHGLQLLQDLVEAVARDLGGLVEASGGERGEVQEREVDAGLVLREPVLQQNAEAVVAHPHGVVPEGWSLPQAKNLLTCYSQLVSNRRPDPRGRPAPPSPAPHAGRPRWPPRRGGGN